MHCIWCHNPEGISPKPQTFYDPERCMCCRRCEAFCEKRCHRFENGEHLFDRMRCISCGKCAAVCEPNALEPVGYSVTASEIFSEVLIDKPFFGKDGGVTLSGGEPLMQPEFSSAILSLANENGIGTCVETSGFASKQTVRSVARLTDIFHFDIKETDPGRHKSFTGVSNETILSNLSLLNELNKRVILRCPVIPGLNLRREHFEGIARLAQNTECVEAVELEPYHPIGLSKYKSLDMIAGYADTGFLSPQSLEKYMDLMRNLTGKPVRFSNE